MNIRNLELSNILIIVRQEKIVGILPMKYYAAVGRRGKKQFNAKWQLVRIFAVYINYSRGFAFSDGYQ